MNLGLYRSGHALVAVAIVAAFLAWHLAAPRPFGDRDDDNVLYLLTTGWVAVACYVVLALYAARRAAHRLRLSPEFAWKAQLPALERAQSELTGLQNRVLQREVRGRGAIRTAAAHILRRHGVQRVLRVEVERDPAAIDLFRLRAAPREPLGRLAGWLHAHLFYGFAAALVVWFHGGMRCGSTMGLLLNGLSYFVIGSGIVGALLWTFGPTWLTRAERELSVEKAFALRDHYARKLEEARTLPETKARDAAAAAAAAKTAAETATAAAAKPGLAGKELEVAQKAAKKAADEEKKAAKKAADAAAAIAAETERLVPEIATLRGQFAAVQRETARLGRYRTLLRGWRLLHVPCSIVLLALVVVHVLSIWYYDEPRMPAPADLLEALLATPLLAGVADELLDAVRTEAAISDGTHPLPPTAAPRAGFVRFRTLQDGEEVVRQGDVTTELVVVLDGQVEAVQTLPGRPPQRHRVLGPGGWFGESSVHSHHAALATWRAINTTTVAVLEARLLSRLYAEDEGCKGRIDDGYRQDLGLHLRASTLCRDLDDAAIADLQRACKLLVCDEGTVVATAGEPADTVFLVRAGAVQCKAPMHGGDRVLAFYKGNATFGEHAITTPDAKWPADYVALMRSALVAMPRAAFDRLGGAARSGVVRAANRLVGAGDVDAMAGGAGGSVFALDELHVMVERESVKGGRALVIDRGKCVRCNMCVESCVAVHDDHVPRLSKVGTPVATDEVLVTACYHCELPQCMLSCEYAAIRRDPQGRVRFEYDSCVGCASCIDGCPYGVIRLVEPAPPPEPIQPLLASLPLIGKWFRRDTATAAAELPGALRASAETMVAGPGGAAAPAVATGEAPAVKTGSVGVGAKISQVTGKTVKCDLCAGLPFEACVYNCPTTAITRREPQSLFDRRRAP